MCYNFSIGNFSFNEKSKTYLIAEIGINHNGDIETAKKLIDLAKESGAHCVKFQSFKAEKLVKKDNPAFSMFKNLELTEETHKTLYDYCNEKGIEFLSTPFDFEGADLLEKLGVSAYKIASSDVTNIPLIEHVAKKGKPIILSTGMATLTEVQEACEAITNQNNDKIVILHCVSLYPTGFDQLNLNSIPFMKNVFKKFPIGLSDHTEGRMIAPVSVALGAKVIEKHFTFDQNAEGPDHKLSLDYKEFKKMADDIENVELALGDYSKLPSSEERDILVNSRTSIFAAKELKKDTILTDRNMIIKRPATGINPKFYNILKGKKLRKDVKEEEAITWEMI